MDAIGNEEPILESHGFFSSLSKSIGAPEPAVRLLLTILAGYPIAAVYRCFVLHQSLKSLHHIFFACCGVVLCFFNYGLDTYHSLIAIGVTCLLVRLLRYFPRLLLVVNFVFHMVYLLTGYYLTESGDYDILWTMPHCVLVLRLIGFGFDVADGCKPHNILSKEQQSNALGTIPTILEMYAFAYFPCSFIVGPQFPFQRYKRFIDGEFRQYKGCISSGVKRFLLGAAYLILRQVVVMKLPDDYFLTDNFHNQPFMWRIVYLGIWGKASLYKYISCWLLTEGALMCLGFSYLGKNANGEDDWSGCSNVKLLLLETGTTMQHYVQSFNVNTNQWVSQYIYKRLKFLNNRTISYVAALCFLAVWHGFHNGYYMTFLLEYLIVTMEKQTETMYNEVVLSKYGHILNGSVAYKILKTCTLKAYNIIYMGWCLVPFIFLSYKRWLRIFAAVNYFGFIYMILWVIVYGIYKHNYSSKSQIPNLNDTNTVSSKSDVNLKKSK